jgi:cell wall-associated NlpC family hydrolase
MTVVASRWPTSGPPAGSAERVTQALLGEPALVLDERGDWARVALPWQPGPDPRGYLGWVRRAHLRAGHPTAQAAPGGPPDVLDAARRLLGAPYLWGGLGPAGIDCSGLVHLAYRQRGHRVPRDAADQHAAAERVPIPDAGPGDLFFFARADGHVVHVGLVTESGGMLHASEEEGVAEGPVSPSRRAHLIAAGRLCERS